MWNVGDWPTKFPYCNFKYSTLIKKQYDIIYLCETWLRKDQTVSLPGYSWFGQNRFLISQRAIRGSGGVGILVKSSLLQDYNASTLDSQMEGILWLKLTDKLTSQNLCLCVCYLPPSSSSRGDRGEEFLDCLGAQITLYRNLGTICICGDLNSRCGNLQDISLVCDTDIPPRKILDVEQNLHGKQFIDLLRSLELYTLNGRGKDNYTYISRLGCSVVDYCVVEIEEFNKFSHFSVTSMQDVISELDYQDNRQVPDHSLLTWQINLDQVGDSLPYSPNLDGQQPPPPTMAHYNLQKVPQNFMEDRNEEVNQLINVLNTKPVSQDLIDKIYSQFCDIVKNEMEDKLPRSSPGSHKQPFHKTLVEPRAKRS